MQRLPPPKLPDFIGKELPYERYRVQVGEHRMHVMEHGEGVPVVLLHGNPTWGFLWRKVARALDGVKARLVMPDLVGLGLSDRPTHRSWHTLENHARQVAGLIDALGLGPVVLVGQDWGGPIGGAACALRPGLLAGVVLLNTVVGPPRPGFRPTAFHRLARVPVLSQVLFRGLGFPQNVLWTAQGERSSIRGDVARAYRWPLRKLAQSSAPLALARMVPDGPSHPSIPMLERCREQLASFRGPAQIVWGDRDPVLGRALKRVQETLPGATVTRTQAGHFLQEEVPQEIAAAIRRVVEAS